MNCSAKRGDRAMVLISHDPGYLRDHCNRFALLHGGKLSLFDDFDLAYDRFREVIGLSAPPAIDRTAAPDRAALVEVAQHRALGDERFRMAVREGDWSRDAGHWASRRNAIPPRSRSIPISGPIGCSSAMSPRKAAISHAPNSPIALPARWVSRRRCRRASSLRDRAGRRRSRPLADPSLSERRCGHPDAGPPRCGGAGVAALARCDARRRGGAGLLRRHGSCDCAGRRDDRRPSLPYAAGRGRRIDRPFAW